MKLAPALAAVLTAGLITFNANPVLAASNSFKSTSKPPPPQAGLAWRCGKRNPAMWGTFGNGCLKQYRAWKKGQGN